MIFQGNKSYNKPVAWKTAVNQQQQEKQNFGGLAQRVQQVNFFQTFKDHSIP